jgi:hypothetical protein
MSLDPKIKEAIISAATETGQDIDFADKLIAWVEDLSNGNDRLDNNDSVKRRLNILYEATKTDSSPTTLLS